jgi:threonine aldolase
LYALQNNIERLKEDHENAKFLAERINANPNLEIDLQAVQTNILLFHPKNISVEEGLKRCKDKGLLVSVGKIDLIRAITHLDVTFDEVKKAADIIDEVFA